MFQKGCKIRESSLTRESGYSEKSFGIYHPEARVYAPFYALVINKMTKKYAKLDKKYGNRYKF